MNKWTLDISRFQRYRCQKHKQECWSEKDELGPTGSAVTDCDAIKVMIGSQGRDACRTRSWEERR